MPTKLLSKDELRERMGNREFLAGQEVSSIDVENRTVDIIFFTGIDVPRTDWWTGSKYILRFVAEGADFSLLNNGAPVLDNHNLWAGSVSQKGKVEKAWQDGKDSKATLRFSKRQSVNELWQDIQDKIVTKFSMGVQILAEEKITEGNQEIRLAKKWQPFELSIVPIPADFGTTTLAAECGDPRAQAQKGSTMDKEETTGTSALTVAVDQEALTREAVAAERLRIQEIEKFGKHGKMDAGFITHHIGSGTTVENFCREALVEQARRCESQTPTQEAHATLGITRDESDTRREAMTAAILNRFDPSRFPITEPARQFVGLSLIDIGRECLDAKGIKHRGLSKDQIVTLSLQSTSDFPYILANSLNKTLRAGYEIADALSQWKKIAALRSASDFKTQSDLQFDSSTRLEQVKESGEFHRGSLTESRETWALKTYGQIIGLTRQVIINDDLGAFTRVPMLMGQEVAILEATTVWGILTANGNLADGNALFVGSTTLHKNLASSAAAIAVDSLGTAISMMMKQTTPGDKVMNVAPKYLVVPTVKLGLARQYTSSGYTPTQPSVINPWAGSLEPIAEARLDTASATAWYLFADPSVAPVLIYAYLQGQSGPYTETRQGFDVDGVEVKIRHDFGAAAVDYRGAVKNAGA